MAEKLKTLFIFGMQLSPHARIHHLYKAHHRWLCQHIYRRLGCGETATDLAQDVFVRLLGRTELPQMQEPKAYLTHIANGLLIDKQRRQALEKAWAETVANLPEQVQPSAEEQCIILDTLTHIDLALNKLKPRAKESFLLSRLEGLSYNKIAQLQKVSLSTVEKDIQQALKQCFLFFSV